MSVDTKVFVVTDQSKILEAKVGPLHFTKQLDKDFKDQGIEDKYFINLLPGPIVTKLYPESYKDGRVKLLTPEMVASRIKWDIGKFINDSLESTITNLSITGDDYD
jgi:hypothetical protein